MEDIELDTFGYYVVVVPQVVDKIVTHNYWDRNKKTTIHF